jgi:4'-phosphopantetheinyl transferase
MRTTFNSMSAGSEVGSSCEVDEFHPVEVSGGKFAVSSARLSTVLSRYGGCRDSDVRVGIGRFGKPELLQPKLEGQLDFSVSHCDGHHLIAVSLIGNVGVDLERVRPVGDVDRMASMYFNPSEAQRISAVRGECKLKAFFTCWTLKEAYTKALGTGLLTPLETFAFPESSWGLMGATSILIHGREWTSLTFQPWPGYTAALVIAGRHSPAAFHFSEEYAQVRP